MTAFWIAAAALLVIALLLVVLPLMRQRPAAHGAGSGAPAASGAPARGGNVAILREQLTQLDVELADGLISAEAWRAARREIERRALEEEGAKEEAGNGRAAASGRATKTALALAIGVPLVATVLYAAIGNPQAIVDPGGGPGVAANGEPQVSRADVEAMVQKLADRMEAEPGDPRGWTLLGRTYAAMQRFPEANRAYARATALSPNDAQLLADAADVMAMTQGGAVAGAPEALLARALQIEPANLKALALAGSAAFERGDFTAAVVHWTKARSLAPDGSEFATGLERSIADARAGAEQAGKPLAPAAATSVAAAPPAAPSVPRAAASGATPAGAAVTVRISLAPALAAKVAPGDTVFVFARAAEGPRMPLAIVRKTVADLPFSVTLDDAMAMSPALKLSNFANVVLGARVSKSGDAMPKTGDLVGQTGPVPLNGAPLAITIDRQQE